MTNNAFTTSETRRLARRMPKTATVSGAQPAIPPGETPPLTPRGIKQLSPFLVATAAILFAIGVASGWYTYLHRSPVPEAQAPGTNAWTVHLILAAVAAAWYGAAAWRHRRRFGPRSGRLLLLAPLGRTAAARLAVTMRRMSWRTVAVLPPLALITYGFWRAGWQVTSALDPSQTVNAWGGPTYPGAMFAHYLDASLGMAVCACLLAWLLLPVPREGA